MEKQELIKQILEALRASGFEGNIVVSDDAGDTTVSVTPQEPVDDGSLAYLFRNYKDDGKREPLIDFGERVGNEIFDLSSVLAPLFEAAQAAQIQGQALLKAQLEEELNELRCIDEVVSRAILEKEKIVADNQIMLSILARDKEAYYARANEIIEQLAYL